MKKNKLYFLILITVFLGFSAIYMGYLIYMETQSAPKIAGEMEVADQPLITGFQSEEDALVKAPKIIDAGIGSIELTMDKEAYISHEDVEMTLNLEVDNEIENAEIRITGIKPHQTAYIRETKVVDLKEGENTIVIVVKAPSCTSGCGGVYPGPYDIEAEVFVDEGLAGQTLTTITLAEE